MADVQFRLVAALVCALAAGGSAWAQETTTPTEGATETPPAEGGPAITTPELSMGEDVVDPNAPGTIYVKETQGAWDIRCIRTETGNDPCQIFQALKDSTGTTVAEFTMVALENGGDAVAGATATTPLGTLLTEPLLIAIDGAAAKRYPYTWCDQDGCHSRIGFNAEGLAAMKKGAEAQVVVVPLLTADQPVELTMSLSGFTAAFDTMKDLNIKAAEANAAAAPEATAPATEGTTAPATEGTTAPAEGQGN